jgi:hypothetical protein
MQLNERSDVLRLSCRIAYAFTFSQLAAARVFFLSLLRSTSMLDEVSNK